MPMLLSTMVGKPPPARGRRLSRLAPRGQPGKTPACAGTTLRAQSTANHPVENPRLRGDDLTKTDDGPVSGGKPPPARGRPPRLGRCLPGRGKTPACAGTTTPTKAKTWSVVENPRLRGDDLNHACMTITEHGKPPPARGRRQATCERGECRRKTPACAGTTPSPRAGQPVTPENPRLRGDDGPLQGRPAGLEGKPPPARGRRPLRHPLRLLCGKTPACAGTTARTSKSSTRAAENPRLRGDDALQAATDAVAAGKPPPARGRRDGPGGWVDMGGKTPACAGTTLPPPSASSTTSENPRLRGDDDVANQPHYPFEGKPPPARGRLPARTRDRRVQRKTPACAGTTSLDGPGQRQAQENPRLRGDDYLVAQLRVSMVGKPPPARGRRCLLNVERCA